jgi:membrane associated rhomboid family serine protease
MGVSSRDYYREPTRSSGMDFRDWEFWKKMIAVNAVVFLLQLFLTRAATREDFIERNPQTKQRQVDRNKTVVSADGNEFVSDNESTKADDLTQYEMEFAGGRMMRQSLVDDWCSLDPDKVKQGQIWRLVTAGFLHDRNSIWHIVINMVFLWLFGRRLEDRYGHNEFGAFYFASLLASSFMFVGISLYTGSNVPAIGASGAVWGVVALYALLFPYETVFVYFIHVQIRVLAAIYFLADLHPLLLSINGEQNFGSGVAHAAHVGGAVFGFLYWYRNWELMPLLGRATHRKFRKYRRPTATETEPRILKMPHRGRTFTSQDEAILEQQMDSVLARISVEGEQALSPEEREILDKAKEIIRQKRAST